ncbi:rhomboid family intramembrane serine protease [Chloroflexota bacterium]
MGEVTVYRNHRSLKLTPVWVIIGVNFLLFLATYVNRELIFFFLGLQPAIFLLQPWTIVTNLFIHAGLGHIIFNMLTLYFFGTYLSRLVGNTKFLLVYFCGGILGNILFIFLALLGGMLSIRFLGSPFSVAVGASGAVFALGGALAAMKPRLRVLVFPIPVPIPLWVAVIGGFFVMSFFPQVAWQAHLGGLVFGLVTGYFFRKSQRLYF